MSFILQDKNLLNLIYKMAESEGPAISIDLVNRLFDNLSSFTPSKASMLSGKEANWQTAGIHNLSNVKALLIYINDRVVSFSGNKVSIPSEQASSIPDNERGNYKNYQGYIVYPEGLKKYIEMLISSPSYSRDPLYRLLLGSIIKEVKQIGIDISTPLEEKDRSIFKFNTLIDLNLNLQKNSGDVELFTSDLNNLNDWLTKKQIVLKKLGRGVLDNDAPCAFLQYLYAQPELTSFKSNIDAAAKKINCTLPSAPASGETATQTGKAEGPGGLGFLNLIYVEMSKDHAPYYGYNDGVIFEMGEKGIIPFLTRLAPLAEGANLTNISAASRNLLPKFETFRTNILGIDVLKSTSRSPNMTRQLGGLYFIRRSPIAEASKNNLISLIEQLHNQVVLPLCDQLRLNSNDFEVRKGFKINNITSAFTEILAAANAEHPDR